METALIRFSDKELAKYEHVLNNDGGAELIDFMRHLSLGQHADAYDEELRAQAIDLGWLDAAGQRSTIGIIVSDSCREYLFWLERGRRLPWAEEIPDLGPRYFSGKTVVEIGSGMGANLMALSQSSSIVGVEPMEMYVQLGELFSKKEGVRGFDTKLGKAENLPQEDNSVDAVLCVTSHQYFDVVPAMKEIARVLRPGGEAFFFGATMQDILRQELRDRKGTKRIFRVGLMLANTISYSIFEKRVIPARGDWTTGRPVHPTASKMWHWMQCSGIEPIREKLPVGEDSCLRGVKA